MNTTTLYQFDIVYICLAIILSILSCITALAISHRFKKSKKPVLVMGTGAFFLAITFLVTHIVISASVGLTVSTSHFMAYKISYFVICFVGSLVALGTAQVQSLSEKDYISGSLILAFCILIADYAGFSLLFYEHIELKPLLIVFSLLLTLNASFSIYRFFNQLNAQENNHLSRGWGIIGCIIAGTSLGTLPFAIVVSIIDFPDSAQIGLYDYLTPYLLALVANLLMTLVPNLFGESIAARTTVAYRSLFDHNPLAVFSIDLNGNITHINQHAAQLVGFPSEQLVGLSIKDFLQNVPKETLDRYISGVMEGNVQTIETRIHHRTDKEIDVKISAIRTIVHDKTIGIFGIVEDVTEAKKAAKQVKYLAYNDEVTSLPNRRYAQDALSKLAANHTAFSILLLDIDRFKRINDMFGHSFGDRLLEQVSQILRIHGDERTITARLGGDEFLLILPEQDAVDLAEKLVEQFKQPIHIEGYDIQLTASIGIAHFPLHTNNVDDLLKFADIAMYEAKDNGANSFSQYNTATSAHMLDKLELENDLRKALEEKKLYLVYQPKIQLASNTLSGAEALLRWNHPIRGMIPPDVFIPIAEESGLIVEIDHFVTREVINQITQWQHLGKLPVRVSVNLSLTSLLKGDFADYTRKILHDTQVSGDLLEFEITERVVMKNEEIVNSTLQKLRTLGTTISIDDFGTGYSSLSYLNKLRIDCLKIDKSFIDEIETNKEIVSAIISMAQNLRLSTIAEGVETVTQVTQLMALGCDEVQGYYFSPPIEAKTFEDLLGQRDPYLTQA